VEGFLAKGQNVIVVVEDLISTGKQLTCCREAYVQLANIKKGMAAIFTYGFDVAIKF
jgi:orotate phosphoribosyltransferase